MAVTQYFKSLDSLFEETSGTNIVINELIDNNMVNLSDENIINSIMTVYDQDVFSNVPKCKCLEEPMVGSYYENLICPNCGAPVKKPYEDIKAEIWLRSIIAEGRELRFLSPIFYYQLSKLFVSGKKNKKPDFNFINYLIDTSINIPELHLNTDMHLAVKCLLEDVLENQRGYYNFMLHLKDILVYLSNSSKFKNKAKAQDLLNVYEEIENSKERDVGIFSSYLPILSNKIFVMENTAKGRFVDLKASMSLSIVKNWITVCRMMKNNEKLNNKPITLEKAGNITAKVVATACNLFITFFKNSIAKKEGIFRRHIYGYKVGFSFRGTIVARDGSEIYDKSGKNMIRNDPVDGIDIPWRAAVGTLELHIINKLLKRGYSVKDLRRKIDSSYVFYDEEINQIMNELMDEVPDRKLPVLGIRNPTLLRGSLMLMHVRSIKTDLRDDTIGLNPLVVKVFNGDFDGDNMSFMGVFDKHLQDLLYGFKHEFSLFGVEGPCAIAGFLTSLATGNQILSNFVMDVLNEPNNDKLYDMILDKRKRA